MTDSFFTPYDLIPFHQNKLICFVDLKTRLQTIKRILSFFLGSLPPSPADSGVSDVDSSSSAGQPACSEELKARLGMPTNPSSLSSSAISAATIAASTHLQQQGHLPPGTFLRPNFYHHNSPPFKNIWNNRPSKCETTLTRL